MKGPYKELIFLTGILGLATAGLAQDVSARRVTDHVTVLNMANLGMHTNVTVVEGEKGLVAIETEITPYIAGKIKAAAEETLGRTDWAYVINTHGHLHHAGGNAAFAGVQVIGHKKINVGWLEDRLSTPEGRRRYCADVGVTQGLARLRGLLADARMPPSEKLEIRRRIAFMEDVEREILTGFEVVSPTITFEDRYTLDLGDVHLELIYWGDAINHSSIFVRVVEDDMLIGMGMGRGWLPDFYGELNLDGIRRAVGLLKELRGEELGIRMMLGVHNPEVIRTTDHFRPRQEYLEDLLNGLTRAREQGMSLEQVKKEFVFNRRFARLRGDFQNPQNLEEVHQANIDKIWALLTEGQS